MKKFNKGGLLRSTMMASVIAFGGTAALVLAPAASAQDYTSGGIEGTVYNSSGMPASGVVVNLISSDRGFDRTSTTGQDGEYRFPRLSLGDYTIGIEGRQEDFRVAVGTVLRKDFNLGGIEEIVATGTRKRNASFDFEAATTGLNIDVDELFALTPLPRDLAGLTLLTPGATSGDSAFGNLVSISGSSVAENVYYLNGMNLTDFRNFLGSGDVPFEFYDQVQTKSGGLPAEFGRTTGGVSNAVSKSGSNEFHFGASVYHENEEWRASARNIESDGDITAANRGEIRESTESNFWASGPIIKDRLFFYGLYSPREQIETQNSAISGETIEYVTDNPFYGGKLDLVISDDHLLEFTGFRNFAVEESNAYDAEFNNSGRITEVGNFAGAGTTESGGDVMSLKYTGQLAENLTVSLMYGEQTNAQTTASAKDVNPVIYDRRDGNNFIKVGDFVNFLVDEGNDKRELIRADADYYVDDFFGDHHIRFGYDQEKLTADANTVLSGGTYFAFFDGVACDAQRDVATGETCVRVREYNSGGSFQTNTTAYYIQDSWSVTDDLTLNLGLRNETFENQNGTGDVFISVDNQWAPRLSLAYQPSFDDSGNFTASYARYYLPVATNTNIRSSGAETFIHRWYELDGQNADDTPIYDPATIFSTQIFGDGTAPTPEALVDENLEPQNMDEFVVGYATDLEGKFGGELGNWNVGAALTYTSLNKVIEDISIDAGVLAYCEREAIAGCEDTFGPRELHQYVLTNPGNDVSVVIDDLPGGAQRATLTAEELGYPEAERTYVGLEMRMDRVVEGSPLDLHASWTISKSEGNYEGSVKSDNGQDDAGLTTDYDFPELTDNANGYLPNHRAHKIKAYGSYRFNDQFSIGANYALTSPRKYGSLGEHPSGATNDLYGDAWYCGGVATPRGTQLESDWSSKLDLNFGYTVPAVTDGSLTLRADIFNVFNSQSVTDIDEYGDQGFATPQLTNTTYGRAIGYQAPRYVRIGADLRY